MEGLAEVAEAWGEMVVDDPFDDGVAAVGGGGIVVVEPSRARFSLHLRMACC